MAHCPPELLDDIGDVLDQVRAWAGIAEKKAGVFYLGRQPFLHFHLARGGGRRADVKGPAGWQQIDLPRPVSATRRRALLRDLRVHYRDRRSPAYLLGRHRRPPSSGART